MSQMKSIQMYVSLIVIFLNLSAHGQAGVIEMKNGEYFEVADDRFYVDGEQLKYFKEKINDKGVSLYGFRSEKQKQEYLDKIGAVPVNNIKMIHMQGQLLVGKKVIADFIGIRYIKVKRRYEEFYVIEDGECSLLVKSEDANAIFSYYVHKKNEDPYILHKQGIGIGPKFKSRSEKYFADCGPAMDYIKKDLKKTTLPELIKIYNANCAK